MNCGAHFCFTEKCLFKARTVCHGSDAATQRRRVLLAALHNRFLTFALVSLSLCLLLLSFPFLIGGPTTGSESNRGAS